MEVAKWNGDECRDVTQDDENKSRGGFEMWELVWARLKAAGSWWPGQISSIPPPFRKKLRLRINEHCVFWYGSRTYSCVPKENVAKFEPNSEIFSRQCAGPLFHRAMRDIADFKEGRWGGAASVLSSLNSQSENAEIDTRIVDKSAVSKQPREAQHVHRKFRSGAGPNIHQFTPRAHASVSVVANNNAESCGSNRSSSSSAAPSLRPQSLSAEKLSLKRRRAGASTSSAAHTKFLALPTLDIEKLCQCAVASSNWRSHYSSSLWAAADDFAEVFKPTMKPPSDGVGCDPEGSHIAGETPASERASRLYSPAEFAEEMGDFIGRRTRRSVQAPTTGDATPPSAGSKKGARGRPRRWRSAEELRPLSPTRSWDDNSGGGLFALALAALALEEMQNVDSQGGHQVGKDLEGSAHSTSPRGGLLPNAHFGEAMEAEGLCGDGEAGLGPHEGSSEGPPSPANTAAESTTADPAIPDSSLAESSERGDGDEGCVMRDETLEGGSETVQSTGCAVAEDGKCCALYASAGPCSPDPLTPLSATECSVEESARNSGLDVIASEALAQQRAEIADALHPAVQAPSSHTTRLPPSHTTGLTSGGDETMDATDDLGQLEPVERGAALLAFLSGEGSSWAARASRDEFEPSDEMETSVEVSTEGGLGKAASPPAPRGPQPARHGSGSSWPAHGGMLVPGHNDTWNVYQRAHRGRSVPASEWRSARDALHADAARRKSLAAANSASGEPCRQRRGKSLKKVGRRLQVAERAAASVGPGPEAEDHIRGESSLADGQHRQATLVAEGNGVAEMPAVVEADSVHAVVDMTETANSSSAVAEGVSDKCTVAEGVSHCIAVVSSVESKGLTVVVQEGESAINTESTHLDRRCSDPVVKCRLNDGVASGINSDLESASHLGKDITPDVKQWKKRGRRAFRSLRGWESSGGVDSGASDSGCASPGSKRARTPGDELPDETAVNFTCLSCGNTQSEPATEAEGIGAAFMETTSSIVDDGCSGFNSRETTPLVSIATDAKAEGRVGSESCVSETTVLLKTSPQAAVHEIGTAATDRSTIQNDGSNSDSTDQPVGTVRVRDVEERSAGPNVRCGDGDFPDDSDAAERSPFLSTNESSISNSSIPSSAMENKDIPSSAMENKIGTEIVLECCPSGASGRRSECHSHHCAAAADAQVDVECHNLEPSRSSSGSVCAAHFADGAGGRLNPDLVIVGAAATSNIDNEGQQPPESESETQNALPNTIESSCQKHDSANDSDKQCQIQSKCVFSEIPLKHVSGSVRCGADGLELIVCSNTVGSSGLAGSEDSDAHFCASSG
mmetsp:Transcript_58794/g.155660  ORF Transcript_58794/g.155660 Transcript_58794/m.155660 type:complete len:1311 (+) Transcript_58794:251-4183(+)